MELYLRPVQITINQKKELNRKIFGSLALEKKQNPFYTPGDIGTLFIGRKASHRGIIDKQLLPRLPRSLLTKPTEFDTIITSTMPATLFIPLVSKHAEGIALIVPPENGNIEVVFYFNNEPLAQVPEHRRRILRQDTIYGIVETNFEGKWNLTDLLVPKTYS